jgi:hypothetical protein
MLKLNCTLLKVGLIVFVYLQSGFIQTAKAADVPAKPVGPEMPPEPLSVSYKFTASYYQASDNNDAVDINLRANYSVHTAWMGEYSDKNGFHQFRTGYEYSPNFDFVRPTFSAQLAGGGFLGGSVTSEVGGDTYAIIGVGRTNLRNYYNLNFDPNDAITFGMGTRAFSNTELSLFQVFDDRLNTHQRITHFVWRYKPTNSQRITVDASYKTGLDSGNDFIHGYGLSFDYGYKQFFARVAREQYANFATSDLTRFSVGMRF